MKLAAFFSLQNRKLVFLLAFVLIPNFIEARIPLNYLIDNERQYTSEKIMELFRFSPEIFQKTDDCVNIRFQARKIWIITRVEKPIEEDVLLIKNIFLDTIGIYFYQREKMFHSVKGGDRFHFKNRYYSHTSPNFKIPDGTQFICMEIITNGPVQVPVEFSSFDYFINTTQQNTALHFLYFGFIILTLILSVVAYFYLKDSIFVYYPLSLFSSLVITSLNYGYLYKYVWPGAPQFNVYSIFLYGLAIFNLTFVAKFLSVKQHSKKLYLIYRIFYLTFLVTLLLKPFSDSILVDEVIFAHFFFLPFLALLSGVLLYKRLDKNFGKYYFAGSAVFFFSIIIYVASINGAIPLNPFTDNAIQIGSAIEIVFFNLAILNKLKIFKRDREKLILLQNKRLEYQVENRTMELLKKNELIEQKNNLLKEQQELLEKKVEDRTHELIHANNDLHDRNFRLEQFANITAHNLRGPVVTLLGLCNIFNENNITDPVNILIIEKLRESGHKLDSILKDLTSLLDLHRNTEDMKENINLDLILLETQQMLSAEISASKAIIKSEFNEALNVLSIPVYLKNIFYNIISNGIKYHKKYETPVIEIRSSIEFGYFCISFRDNGIGIDLSQFGNKIFQPYQRFHLEVPGKGLGLFIVKTQVESMKGYLELKSSFDEGTCINIFLPLDFESNKELKKKGSYLTSND